jgi:hypothetical protein
MNDFDGKHTFDCRILMEYMRLIDNRTGFGDLRAYSYVATAIGGSNCPSDASLDAAIGH